MYFSAFLNLILALCSLFYLTFLQDAFSRPHQQSSTFLFLALYLWLWRGVEPFIFQEQETNSFGFIALG